MANVGRSEPIYYQLLSRDSTALSAPLDLNPGGDLINATPDDTSDRQLWELMVDLMTFEGASLRVVMRNKYTGFVAAAPIGDNTWGVTQQEFYPTGDWTGQMWTFAATDDLGWKIRPAGRQNQNLNAMDADIGSEVGVRSWGGGEPVEVWEAVRARP